jgi:uncharacterized protein
MASSVPTSAVRYHRWVARRPVLVLVLAALVGAGGMFLASRLKLKTAFVELLPSNDRGVVALAKTQARIGDLSLLLIGVRSPDYQANLRYAEELTQRLRAMPKSVVQLATYNVRDLKAFFERNKWLYAKEEDLESIRDRLRTEISKRKNPLFVSLGDDEPLEDMQKRMEHKDGLDERFPGGVFTNEGGEYVWIAALPPGGLFDNAGDTLFKAAHALIKELPPARYGAQMHAEVAGPIATSIASREAIERDILWVTVTCLVLVGLSIGLYFRRLRAIPLTGIPAALGAVLAFAVAELTFGYLNSSTAFLGSIILGNGINYAIVLMSRYEEHRARGDGADESLSHAIGGTWRGTLVASVCASAAYASLMVTSFRGFSQFGVMAAAGALSCWAATYTVLPAMLVLLDRRHTKRAVTTRAPLNLGPLARFIGRHGAAVSVVFALCAAGSLMGLTHFLKDPFEYDFRRLNAKLNTTKEAQEFGKSFDHLFGRWPSPTIVLADSLDEVEPLKDTIRRQDAEQAARFGPPGTRSAQVIGQIVTIYDLLPGPPDVQKRKLALIADIDKLKHDKSLALLNDDEKKKLDKIDPQPATLKELVPMDLPAIARRPFTEVDGTVGRVVLVYPPDEGISVWSGRDLLRIAGVLQFLHLPSGKLIETSGAAVVFGAMIRSILQDGPIATGVSLIAVLFLVVVMIRPFRSALIAVGILILGVTLMVGGAGWARVHVTFLNFIALPITFGIGAEYVLNVVTRYREERDILKAVVSTGAAVALCSWTTIVGYGSLLAARNQALQGFGAMAILGEISCLSAAIVALPAFIVWRQRARDNKIGTASAPALSDPSAAE